MYPPKYFDPPAGGSSTPSINRTPIASVSNGWIGVYNPYMTAGKTETISIPSSKHIVSSVLSSDSSSSLCSTIATIYDIPLPIYFEATEDSTVPIPDRNYTVHLTKEWIQIYNSFMSEGKVSKLIELYRDHPKVLLAIESSRMLSSFLFGNERTVIKTLSMNVNWSDSSIQSKYATKNKGIESLAEAAYKIVLLFGGSGRSARGYNIKSKDRIRTSAQIMEILTMFGKIWGGVKFLLEDYCLKIEV